VRAEFATTGDIYRQGCEPDVMERFTAERVAELRDPLIDGVAPMSDERWLVSRPKGRELLVVDSQLQPIWRLGLPSRWRGRHAVTEDLSRVALSLQREVLVLSGDGDEVCRLAHPDWADLGGRSGCCAFAPDQPYLWATVPSEEGFDELWLVDVDQQVVVDRRALESTAVGCDPVYHPDGQTIGLDIGEGQDGSLIRWARADRGRIQLRLVQSFDRTLVDVHPSGAEYLSTPHDNTQADDLVRHRFVDDTAIEGLSAWDVFPFGDEWAAYAGYLTDELIVAGTEPSERHVLVRRAPLGLLATIAYPAGSSTPGWIVAARAGSWLTHNDDGVASWVMPQLDVGSGHG
jgi:hypothetical protein